jgi:hypothetical protein
MPKVVLSFGDTLEQGSPLSGHLKLTRPVLFVEVADRVPGSTVRFETISLSVCRRRYFERLSIDAREDEDALANLRYPIVGSVEMEDLWIVLGALPTVDRMNFMLKELPSSFILNI